MDALK